MTEKLLEIIQDGLKSRWSITVLFKLS